MATDITRDGQIAILAIDNPPVNALGHAVRAGLAAGLAELAADDGITAIVLIGRGRTFIAGADITEFGKPPKPPFLPDVISQIEQMGKPVIAAIHGQALGGGLEVALGCHYRLADDAASLGLPEVNLGLIPGAGGTQRLPRLIGVAPALEMITSGTPVKAARALELGLLDAVVSDALQQGAVDFARNLLAAGPPDLASRRLCDRAVAADTDISALRDAARPAIVRKARGAIAPLRALDLVEAAATLPFGEGLARERAVFMELLPSDQSAALRHIFFAERTCAKPPADVARDTPPRPVHSVGIIGAGTMGGGIAMSFADAGIRVVQVDMSQEALERGHAVIRKNYERSAKSGRITTAQVDQRMTLIDGQTAFSALADCDLIIEAVFEQMDVKQQVFSQIDAIAKPGAVLATNTSYLDVNQIARFTRRPADVLGMHYFSPANVMKLLEIVRAEATSDDALMTALDIARRTRKTPVVAGVCHGFIGNRMLQGYAREANLLVVEGATPEQVDKALTGWGMAMGLFAVGDLAGLDIGYKSRRDADPSTYDTRAVMVADRLVEAGHLGQKSGSGYYRYDPATRERTVNPEALTIIDQVRAELGVKPRDIDDSEIIARTIYALVNEGAKLLDEGIAQRASDIDVVYVHGYGFPRVRGGPMHYAQRTGLPAVLAAIQGFARVHGPRWWIPAPLLERLVSDGSGFSA